MDDKERREAEKRAIALTIRIMLTIITSAAVSIALVEAFIGHLR